MFAQPKGGSSRARAARARKGHQRRIFKVGTSRHYKGSPKRRVKTRWMF
jgi:hypothetical protein